MSLPSNGPNFSVDPTKEIVTVQRSQLDGLVARIETLASDVQSLMPPSETPEVQERIKDFLGQSSASDRFVRLGAYYALDHEEITGPEMGGTLTLSPTVAFNVISGLRDNHMLIQTGTKTTSNQPTSRGGRPINVYRANQRLKRAMRANSIYLASEYANRLGSPKKVVANRALANFAVWNGFVHDEGITIKLQDLAERAGRHPETILNLSLRNFWLARNTTINL